MNMTKSLGAALAFAALTTVAPGALAQVDEPDPDLVPLPGIVEPFEIAISELGPLAGGFGDFALGPMGPGPGPGRMGRCPMGGGPGGPFGFLQGDLALTDDQFEKLYTLRNQFLDKAGPKMLALKDSERDMRDLMTRATVDKAKVKALQNTINESKAALANLRLDHKLNTLDVLTEEQRKELRRRFIQGGCPGRFMMREKFKEHCPKS